MATFLLILESSLVTTMTGHSVRSASVGENSSRVDATTMAGFIDAAAVGSVRGSYVQSSGSKLMFEIGVGDSQKPFAVSNEAYVAGDLEIISAGYADPALVGTTDRITLLTADSIDGVFDAVTLDGRPLFDATDGRHSQIHDLEGLFRTLEYADDALSLTNYRAIPGDFNGDFEVSFADFLILSGNFGAAGDWTDGDASGDGTVAFGDFLLLSQWFGSSVTPQPISIVPEPTGGLMLVCGVWGFLIGFRKTPARLVALP